MLKKNLLANKSIFMQHYTPQSSSKNLFVVTAIVGIIVGFMYLPFSPIYILGNLTEFEIGLWGMVVCILSIIMLIAAFFIAKIRLFILFDAIVLMFLNFAALYMYFFYIPEGGIYEVFQEAQMSYTLLIPHLIFIILLLISSLSGTYKLNNLIHHKIFQSLQKTK